MGGAGRLAELGVPGVQEILADDGELEILPERVGDAEIGLDVGGDVLDAVDEAQPGVEFPVPTEIESGTEVSLVGGDPVLDAPGIRDAGWGATRSARQSAYHAVRRQCAAACQVKVSSAP